MDRGIDETGPDGDADVRADHAVALAGRLLEMARARQTRAGRADMARLARMMDDPDGKRFTLELADRVLRSASPERAACQLRDLIDRRGVPGFLPLRERIALAGAAVASRAAPQLVMPAVIWKLRRDSRKVIVPAAPASLTRYLESRRRAGARLNINQLGEAVLGHEEAARRVEQNLERLEQPEVTYISVKISSICSRLSLVAFDESVERIKDRLRRLYRAAIANPAVTAEGRSAPKFVNLDMEEYRDLHLTLAAFRQTLDEDEFASLDAGVVLQAYLPDAFPVQQDLTRWAVARHERAGGRIKLRLVKGANLAMERVEASIHGWPQAPYPTKTEVDANYKRMIDYAFRRDRAAAVRIGIGSHNLFDIAYAMLAAAEAGVEDDVEFEMLEGMANHQAAAVRDATGSILLYAPVVHRRDFQSALAYLVRRLDENTAPANFLHDLFGLETGAPAWEEQAARFRSACAAKDRISSSPRRTQNRAKDRSTPNPPGPFSNQPDTDWSLPHNVRWIRAVLGSWKGRRLPTVAAQIDGRDVTAGRGADGFDPSRPGHAAYRIAIVSEDDADRALAAAKAAQPGWAATPVSERRAVLDRVAAAISNRRGDFIGCMALDAGKTVAEADPEVSEAADFAAWYARAFDILGTESDGCRFSPLGVVTVAPPWNFPFAIPAGGALAALMAGNAVILKPAPETVLTARLLADAMWDAGVPRGVLQFVPSEDSDVGRMLIADPRVSGVILTGAWETARLFQSWRPPLRLFAETSGKNSLIVTAAADRDQAAADLVRSAFGHNGQKCSAASLGILESEVYDDSGFLRQLRDAAASLHVGSAWDPLSDITPLVRPPEGKLLRALTELEPGESWLLEPRPSPDNPRLWTPGIKLGVQPGSSFHRTECFGPVLGLMPAQDLDHAIELANAVPFGLTAGLHSLDDSECDRFIRGIEAGSVYVNRHTTGAIVRRQPFGGWKQSSIGPGAKAGGVNYVFQLGTWSQERLPVMGDDPEEKILAALHAAAAEIDSAEDRAFLEAAARSDARAIRRWFRTEHATSNVLGESNVFRYVRCRGILIRAGRDAPQRDIARAELAALACGVPSRVSRAESESDRDFARALDTGRWERVRVVGSIQNGARARAQERGIPVIDTPVVACGRLELLAFHREQSISRTTHRYGHVRE